MPVQAAPERPLTTTPTGEPKPGGLEDQAAIEAAIALAIDPDAADALAKADEDHHRNRRAPLLNRVLSMTAIIAPFLGLVAAMVMLWGVAFNWVYLAVLVVGYFATGFGITIGYHRLFTHRSFQTSRFMTAVLGILGSMTVEGSILDWVATHRRHHQHSDGEDDPHSPHGHEGGIRGFLKGFTHAHIGWFFTANHPDLRRYVKDLEGDALVRRVSNLFPLWAALGIILPGVVAGLVTMSWVGALLGVLWGGAVRIFLVHHVTWSINSACHIWGAQPFRSHDESRNNPVFGLLAFGEGWHNNHHAFPTSAKHGLAWWQFDSSWLLIWAMAKIGLVWNVRVPSAERIESKRA
ncbi:MAG: acyl-CoA desaturase [Phycisphaerales bacterium]